MKPLSAWMQAYGESHQNALNRQIHVICVPLIVWSLLGLLWCLPLPRWMSFSVWLNWSSLFCGVALLFYLRLSWKVAILMLSVAMASLISFYHLASFEKTLWIYLGVFALAWVGQFIGHAIEGKKPSFLQDLQFLLIGPIWVLYELNCLKSLK